MLLGDWPEPLHPTSADGLPRPRTWTGPTRCARPWPACPLDSGAPSPCITTRTSQPEGFAWLAQEIFADDYRGAAVVFRGRLRAQGTADGAAGRRAGLFVRIRRGRDIRGPLTEAAVLADPGNHLLGIADGPGWSTHEIVTDVPGDCMTVMFGVYLAGAGSIELREPELVRTTEVTAVLE